MDTPERFDGDVDRRTNRSGLLRAPIAGLTWLARRSSVAEGALIVWFAWSMWRSKWLSDDGYIYLAYVRNLTENGWGPVLNRGERVEGFTSPAWYGLLSVVNWLRPDFLLDLRQAVLLVSMLLSTIAVVSWIAVETYALRAARLQVVTEHSGEDVRDHDGVDPSPTRGRLNLPLAALAAWYPLHSFATSGLETPLQLLATMAVIVYVWRGQDHDWTVGVLAALLPLVRPELGLLSVMLLARHLWRRRSGRALIAIGVFTSLIVGSVVIRIAVYGQVLPNTYYAKTDTGHGATSGLRYLRDLTMAYGLHWIAAAAVLSVALPLVRGGSRRLDAAAGCRLWFLVAAGLLTAYVVAIGGDFMHARFLLTEVLLMAAVFAGTGTEMVHRLPPSRRLASAAVATAVLFLAAASTEPIQASLPRERAGRPGKFGDIADEARSYRFRNPDLHAWEQSSSDPWVLDGEGVRRLSELLDTEIGYVRGGIGHFTYAGQADGGRVYTYDRLGLTRLDAARLDMHGALLRIGHAKAAPDVMIAANPRVDLHSPYFDGWVDVARFEFEKRSFVVFDPDLVDPLVDAGVMLPEAAEQFRAWILEQLSAPKIDRNFVTFLTMRYDRDDAVRRRVLELSELDEQSAWRGWLDETEDARELLRPNGCFGWSFFECAAKALDRHRVGPIPHLANEPDWVSRP